jgi:hypothetical protein
METAPHATFLEGVACISFEVTQVQQDRQPYLLLQPNDFLRIWV